MIRSELCDLPSAVLRTDWTRAEIAALFDVAFIEPSMSEATQALWFMAGTNSIFTGDRLFAAPNVGKEPMRDCAKLEAAE